MKFQEVEGLNIGDIVEVVYLEASSVGKHERLMINAAGYLSLLCNNIMVISKIGFLCKDGYYNFSGETQVNLGDLIKYRKLGKLEQLTEEIKI
jgi:hypothetical protein